MLASRQTGIKPDENGVALGGGDGAPVRLHESEIDGGDHSVDDESKPAADREPARAVLAGALLRRRIADG